MKTEEEESAPRTSSDADKGKRKKKSTTHLHIGPHARAYRAGLALAFCPMCDAERGLRMTEKEREVEKSSRSAVKDAKANKESSSRGREVRGWKNYREESD